MKINKPLSNAAQVTKTTLVDEDQFTIDYPHCVLPPHFFERVVYLKRKAASAHSNRSARTLLSVQTLDGRDVLSVRSE